ncbi:MAG: response regulator transcription factor [Frankiaceae bacterium]|nr:response regulator transcription factor [Frankiaceae bacterium]MBV9870205.1 response regulator transcription factor [Frankiaceae bacterium]
MTDQKRDRVLVVDDAANLRELLTLLLETEDDFEVAGTARDGEEAVLLAAREQPSIVLLDLAMPVMDGMQALPRLRGILPDAVILVFSAYDQEEMAKESLESGADAYLEKGSTVTQLVDLLRTLRARKASS